VVGALAVIGVDRDELQRRTLRSLRFGQVSGQAAVAGMVAVVSLLAGDLLGSTNSPGWAALRSPSVLRPRRFRSLRSRAGRGDGSGALARS